MYNTNLYTMTTIDKKTNEKLDYVDSLRGVAILMVILVHTSQLISDAPFIIKAGEYGQLGVQLFFVISALTLSISFDKRFNEGNVFSKFLIRRYLRISLQMSSLFMDFIPPLPTLLSRAVGPLAQKWFFIYASHFCFFFTEN